MMSNWLARLRILWHERVLGHTVIVGGGDWTTEDVRQLRRDYPSWVFTHEIPQIDCGCGTSWRGTY